MNNIQRVALVLVVVYGVLLGTADGAPPKKGDLRRTTTTPVTLDKDGTPVVGGKVGLVIQPKAEGNKAEGNLLVVLVREAGAAAPTSYYLAYPVEKGAPARIQVVRKPGPGCYWTERRVPAGGEPDNGSIWEMDIYEVREGPFKGLELRQDKQFLVLSRAPLRKRPKDEYVGRLYDYDDLSDGP
jgi:hypothetical protein